MNSASWNFTIDSSSSFIEYAPYGEGGLGAQPWLGLGWQAWYSGSGGFCAQHGLESSGQARHITSLPGASLTFQYYGTSLYLYGSSNCTFDITIDDNSHTNLTTETEGDGLLRSLENLSLGTHYVNITAHPQANGTQQFGFDYANITIPYDGDPLVAVTYQNTNSSVFNYIGKWSTVVAPQVPSPTSTAPYHMTTSFDSHVTMNFTGGEAVAVYGFRDWGNWLYNVTLSSSVSSAPSQYNGSTVWKIGSALLFFQAGLDPNQTYSLDIMNSDGLNLMLNSVTVYKRQLAASSSTISR
ncbi:hypothetical protein WOLCODRAFT_94833 [Wolfiporia cocos MD-104 SS10]|uniref:Uncharacterized protein n=1 Tax=Wolfiporia cocos (strain MD-104) TaxID=742152 RepID=A0A2H3J8X8_WOLCO|nr:hypothetical protein WOLCODRAFT_94833 [Wolfiporia cocos MD-104 SS10]